MKMRSLAEQIEECRWTPVPRSNGFECSAAEAVEVKRRAEEWAFVTRRLRDVRYQLCVAPDDDVRTVMFYELGVNYWEERLNELKSQYWDGPADKKENV